MASLALLRKQAKDMGIAAAVIRGASTAEELQSILDDHSDNGSSKRGSTKPQKKSATVAKKKNATKKATTKASGNSKKSSAVKSKPVESRNSGKAKRSATGNGNGGRNLLETVDYTVTDGWNAREGSAPSRIIAALRKARGNRAKAFEALRGDVWAFVGKKMRDGTKRTKADAEEMLRYRISRTAWDFALRTGQHTKSSNRAEYGTAGTGTGAWQSARTAQRASKASSKKTTARKASSKKATAKTAARRRGQSSTKRTSKR